jgi:hypothetical protein
MQFVVRTISWYSVMESKNKLHFKIKDHISHPISKAVADTNFAGFIAVSARDLSPFIWARLLTKQCAYDLWFVCVEEVTQRIIWTAECVADPIVLWNMMLSEQCFVWRTQLNKWFMVYWIRYCRQSIEYVCFKIKNYGTW